MLNDAQKPLERSALPKTKALKGEDVHTSHSDLHGSLCLRWVNCKLVVFSSSLGFSPVIRNLPTPACALAGGGTGFPMGEAVPQKQSCFQLLRTSGFDMF